MNVIFHENFYQNYTSDPAAASGRIEAIVEVIKDDVTFITAEPAAENDILSVHTDSQIDYVKSQGIYSIASLAAGGALQAARMSLKEPAFGLIRPPGHHASSDNSWGFCYFNNMAIALKALKKEGAIKQAIVLDIDLHFGDGTINILGHEKWLRIYNIASKTNNGYIQEVRNILSNVNVDIIGISAGFDHHLDDWGGLLATEDYQTIGFMAREASLRCEGGCLAILEGGYNHDVLGYNVAALLDGMSFK